MGMYRETVISEILIPSLSSPHGFEERPTQHSFLPSQQSAYELRPKFEVCRDPVFGSSIARRV